MANTYCSSFWVPDNNEECDSDNDEEWNHSVLKYN